MELESSQVAEIDAQARPLVGIALASEEAASRGDLTLVTAQAVRQNLRDEQRTIAAIHQAIRLEATDLTHILVLATGVLLIETILGYFFGAPEGNSAYMRRRRVGIVCAVTHRLPRRRSALLMIGRFQIRASAGCR